MYQNSIIIENFKNISKIHPIQKIQFYNPEITLIVRTKDILDILLFFKNNFLCQFKILTSISVGAIISSKLQATATKLLKSKVGSLYFPFIWYETLITRAIPKFLGITAGFQTVVFGRWYVCLIIIFFVLVVVYLSILITNIFETDKPLYSQLNKLFSKHEMRFQNFSYWGNFKKMYLSVNCPTTKKGSKKTTITGSRDYTTTSVTPGLMGKLTVWGGKIATTVGSKAAPAAVTPKITIGAQGASAVGTGAVVVVGVGGALIMTGGDQVIRYGVQNGINSMTQPNHVWPPLEMQTPANVWIHGSK